MGTQRRIDFQNSPPSVELLVEPEELPQEYQSIKITAKSKEIMEAYQRGEDVGAIARIGQRKHVRFRSQESRGGLREPSHGSHRSPFKSQK